jgi:hydroxymethylpyrimidine pyrophosphatase-like HAD family hydrolase
MKKSTCDIKKYKELNKSYKIIAFDWDGTAVHTRKDDISNLINALEKLLKQGIYIIVVTGTNFENIDKQFSYHIKGLHTKNLFICTNRGSEVFCFDENSLPILLYRLNIDEEASKLLDKIAEKTKTDIETKAKIRLKIVYDRLNRRKLDLIPEWESPLKSEIGKLIVETEKKLKNAGFEKGINGAFNLMENNARFLGLKDARVTSDVKHIEVGVSDKSNSIKWILENLAKPNNISDREILIIGDEFGNIAGFDGSDYKMVVKNHKDITYFSVGKEPNGLPPMVKHIGGGPECFLKLIQNLVKVTYFKK